MSGWKPGQVAMVTHQDERRRAMSLGGSGWFLPNHGSTIDVSDITPLVCIDLDREEADALDKASRHIVNRSPAWFLLNRIINAIREQTPAPEPPKRWVVKDGLLLWDTARWRGQNLATFNEASDAQAVADALNAAEPTS